MKNFLSILICICTMYGAYNVVFADEAVYREYSVTVASGDTLWDIAGRHAEKNEDLREVMFRITQANNLESKRLYPGQVLKIPLRQQESGLRIATR